MRLKVSAAFSSPSSPFQSGIIISESPRNSVITKKKCHSLMDGTETRTFGNGNAPNNSQPREFCLRINIFWGLNGFFYLRVASY